MKQIIIRICSEPGSWGRASALVIFIDENCRYNVKETVIFYAIIHRYATNRTNGTTVPVYNTCWCHRVVHIQIVAHILWCHEDLYDSIGDQANPGSAKSLLSACTRELPQT